jgi:hypothetical protein
MRPRITSHLSPTLTILGVCTALVIPAAPNPAFAEEASCEEIGQVYQRKGPTYGAVAAWDESTTVATPPWQLRPGEVVIDYEDVNYWKIGNTSLNIGHVAAGGEYAGSSDISTEFQGAINLAAAYGDHQFKASLEQKRNEHTSIANQYSANRNTVVVIASAKGNQNFFDRKKGDIAGHIMLTIRCVGTRETVHKSSALALQQVLMRAHDAGLPGAPERTTSLTSFESGNPAQHWFIVPSPPGEPGAFMIINRETGQPLDYQPQDNRLILHSKVAIFAPAQMWRIEWLNAEQTLARITNHHTGKAIDFVGFDLARPPGMLIDVVEGAPAQRWYVDPQPGGTVVLRNFYNNKVLTFP